MWFKSRTTIPSLAVISFCLIGGATPADADLGDQLFKLLPNDGAADDNFGSSVAISPDGIGAIVGAWHDNDNGTWSGSAYLFDTTTGGQIAKLLANEGTEYDRFGRSVAISGAIAIVGAYGTGTGSAYLFDTTTGRQLFKLLANDGANGDEFGRGVGISGTTAIVGAPSDNDYRGSAYLFDTTTGQQLFKLLANGGQPEDVFGNSVGISGTTVIVGAPGHGSGPDTFGAAYLFDTTTGQQLFELLANDGAKGDALGLSVAIGGPPGNQVAIAGNWTDEDNGYYSGSAYLFDTTTGRQIAKLLADDGAAYDNFGLSVAISGATAIVGADKNDDNGGSSGSAYLFDTTTGQQLFKLLPDDGVGGDWFGISVAISGPPGEEVAIVGAFGDDDNGSSSGSAYLFDAAAPGECPWDLDKSGTVNTSDLLALFAQWGTDGSADFDGNGVVGTSDLLVLLANWGPCP